MTYSGPEVQVDISLGEGTLKNSEIEGVRKGHKRAM